MQQALPCSSSEAVCCTRASAMHACSLPQPPPHLHLPCTPAPACCAAPAVLPTVPAMLQCPSRRPTCSLSSFRPANPAARKAASSRAAKEVPTTPSARMLPRLLKNNCNRHTHIRTHKSAHTLTRARANLHGFCFTPCYHLSLKRREGWNESWQVSVTLSRSWRAKPCRAPKASTHCLFNR